MTDPVVGEPGGPEPGKAESGPGAAPAVGRWGKALLALLGLYAILSLVAAYAQLTDNRPLLDLFDLRRWFTR